MIEDEEPRDLLPLPNDLEVGLNEFHSNSELKEKILMLEDFGGGDDD